MIWHSSSIDDIVKYFSSDISNGLTVKDVAEKNKEYGHNKFYSTECKTVFKCFLSQIRSYTFVIAFIASVFYLLVDIFFRKGAFKIPVIVIALLFIYIFIVSVLEARINRSIMSKSQMYKSTVRVIRNGVNSKIDSVDIVPGDIISLKEGDYIPADARLIYSENLRCDESLLTGAVTPVEKNYTSICSDIEELSKRENMIFSGCYVASGKAKAIVTDIGSYTERGKKLTSLIREEDVIVPIQSRIKKTVALITTAFLLLSACFLVVGEFITQINHENIYDWREYIIMASLLFSVTVPCAYSMLISFNLVLGMKRASRHNCYIQKISELETMCTTNVIICDKTGTLTQSRMKAAKVYVNNELHDVDNFAPDEVAALLKLATLTCDGEVKIDDFGREKHIGDPVETAIISAALKTIKTDKVTIDIDSPRMGEIPLDPIRKIKTVICVIEGKPYAIVKGSASNVLEKCTGIDKENIEKNIKELSMQAYRVIAIAYKQLDELPSMPSAELIENELTFSGLIAIANLPRYEAKFELEDCKKSGINTIMITGDILETAKSAAEKLNLLDKNSVCITGQMIDEMSEEEFDEIFENIKVYSEISSEQRLQIVKKWQNKGKTVAITGDSVSDVLAIKEADVGCSMGITGTEFAKSASELLIADDSYTSIVRGIKEIKGTYLNIRKSLKQAITVGFSLIISMIFGALIFGTSTMPALMILLSGLYFNTISIYNLAFEPAHKDILKRTIHKGDDIVGKDFSLAIFINVLSITVVTLLAYFFGKKYGFSNEYFFVTYVLSALLLSYSNRTERVFITLEPFRCPFYNFTLIVAIATLLIMVMFSPAAEFLKLKTLKIDQVLKCLLLALVVPAINELYKFIKQRVIK